MAKPLALYLGNPVGCSLVCSLLSDYSVSSRAHLLSIDMKEEWEFASVSIHVGVGGEGGSALLKALTNHPPGGLIETLHLLPRDLGAETVWRNPRPVEHLTLDVVAHTRDHLLIHDGLGYGCPPVGDPGCKESERHVLPEHVRTNHRESSLHLGSVLDEGEITESAHVVEPHLAPSLGGESEVGVLGAAVLPASRHPKGVPDRPPVV